MTFRQLQLLLSIAIALVAAGCSGNSDHIRSVQGQAHEPVEPIRLPGGDTPSRLMDRMYTSVEHEDLIEFHACHQREGLEKELLESVFHYLVVQSHLRQAAIAAYGEDSVAGMKNIRGGLLGFDTSWFPQAVIKQDEDSAVAEGPERRTSEHMTVTPSLRMTNSRGRWLMAPAPRQLSADDLKRNIRFAQEATVLLKKTVAEVERRKLEAGQLDERVEKDLRSLH